MMLAIVAFTLPLFGQSTEDAVRIVDNQLGFGARALGMGGAYSAAADDYSAIYWNPAGLAQMKKMEFWMEFSHTSFSNDIVFQSSPSEASKTATKFNSFGLVLPVPTYRGSLVFAFGYQRIKDFEYANNLFGISDQGTDRLSFELDTLGNVYDFWGKDVENTENTSDEGSLKNWSAAAAIDLSPNVSAGVSLNYWTGNSNYLVNYYQLDKFNNFNVFPGDFYDYIEDRSLDTRYSSFNFKFAAMIRMIRILRLGLVVDLPHTINVNEDYLARSSVSFDDGEVIDFEDEVGTFEYDVKMPFRFTAGLSLALGPLLASGSAEYMDWTQIKFDVPSGAMNNPDYSDLIFENDKFRQYYRPTLKLRLGGEVGLPFLGLQGRAGVIYDPSPLKNATTDNDRKFVTLGAGLLVDKVFKIDLAYLIGFWKQTSFDDLVPAGTEEDITLQKLFLTVSYRF